MMVTPGAIIHVKLQSNRHHQQTNTYFFTDGCPSCRIYFKEQLDHFLESMISSVATVKCISK